MDKIQKVFTNLSSKVDITKPRTIALLISAIIIIFAIIYVYQSRKTLEGFTSYTVTGPNDTVLLGDLNKVKVGTTNTNLLRAITEDPLFDTEVRKKITEQTSNGNLVTSEELNNKLSLYDTAVTIDSAINTSLGNYIKKSDITTSSELNVLIDRKINANNVQAQAYVNAQVQQTIPNILESLNSTPKLIGIIHGYPKNYNAFWGSGNWDGVNLILGRRSDKTTDIKISYDSFLSAANSSKYIFSDATNNYPRPWKSIITLFDWKNDFNIFSIATLSHRRIDNIYYTNVFPAASPANDSDGFIKSPFPNMSIKTNTKYLINLNFTSLLTSGWGLYIFYVVFNGSEASPEYIIKYVEKKIGHELNDNTTNFVIETMSNTFNFGIYVLSHHTENVSASTVGINLNTQTGVTIYELPTADSLRATITTTSTTPTTTRTT